MNIYIAITSEPKTIYVLKNIPNDHILGCIRYIRTVFTIDYSVHIKGENEYGIKFMLSHIYPSTRFFLSKITDEVLILDNNNNSDMLNENLLKIIFDKDGKYHDM